MAFQISPGVNVSEVDLTTVIPSVQTTAGAFAGAFVWGPANLRTTVDSEITLVNKFGKPDNNTATSFFTAASYLAYGNNLKVVRSVGANCFNAKANTAAAGVQIPNEVYNIGNDSPEVSVIQLVEIIKQKINPNITYEVIDYPSHYPANDPSRRCPDINKAKKQLGFGPIVKLEEGLRRFLSWTELNYTGKQ